MKTEFVLRIEIANDATLGDANLADIVTKVAESIAHLGLTDNRAYIVRDVNGAKVGTVGRYSSEDADDDFAPSRPPYAFP